MDTARLVLYQTGLNTKKNLYKREHRNFKDEPGIWQQAGQGYKRYHPVQSSRFIIRYMFHALETMGYLKKIRLAGYSHRQARHCLIRHQGTP